MSDATPTGTRSIDLSIDVPGTPEEVWHAIATGPGITSWFIPMTVDEEVDGDVVMDFGSLGRETARVAAWDPPRRVVFESSPTRGPLLAYEWTVEAAAGGTCVVRLVNSGFGTEPGFDGDYDGMSAGWKIFMRNLRLQLTHFRGQDAHAVIPITMLPGPNAVAWSTFCSALGVTPDAGPGDSISTNGPEVPALQATVDSVVRGSAATACLLVLDGPVPGTGFIAAEGDGAHVACSLYLYLYGDGAAKAGREWTEWMAKSMPMPAPEPAETGTE